MGKKILVGIEGHVIIDEDALCLYASEQDEYKQRIMTKKEKEALTPLQMAQIVTSSHTDLSTGTVWASQSHDQAFLVIPLRDFGTGLD